MNRVSCDIQLQGLPTINQSIFLSPPSPPPFRKQYGSWVVLCLFCQLPRSLCRASRICVRKGNKIKFLPYARDSRARPSLPHPSYSGSGSLRVGFIGLGFSRFDRGVSDRSGPHHATCNDPRFSASVADTCRASFEKFERKSSFAERQD